jgi:regulator of protease activity HflC (stomatin/prohibitin superfamily)
MAKDVIVIGGAVLSFIAFLLIVILVPLHFSYVDRQQYGMKRNNVNNNIDRSTVYENGRYAWGVSFGAVTFPSNKIRIQFTGNEALSVFTESGQVIFVEFIFYYRIEKSTVPQLYDAFGLAYENRIISIARSELRNAAPQFVLDNYTSNRQNVADGYYNFLVGALRSKAYVIVDRGSFFMQSIRLPSPTIAQKISIFQTTQSLVTQGFTLTANQTRLETTKNVTTIDNEAEVIRQNATAEAARQVTEANANYFSKVQNEIGSQLALMSSRLGITNLTTQGDLVKFNQMLDRTAQATILTGIKGALIQN